MESSLLTPTYLEITYRNGRALAAYLYLERQADDRSDRTEIAGPGLVVDLNRAGRPIGIEITAPGKVTLEQINDVLKRFNLPLATRADLAPLAA